MQPLVSIIMPCYNAERYIAQSIESVMAQTYQNWELLITDDYSTDGSVMIVEEFCRKDKRINLLKADKHQGIAETRNISIYRAKGRFVAFLDNDDLWMSEKLEKQVGFMLENDVAFTYTSYEIIDSEGVSLKKTIKTDGIVDHEKYLRNTIIGCGTVILDREKTGDFRMPQNDTSDDMALWLNVMRRGFDAVPFDEVLLKYRISKNSASSKKLKAASDVWRVYRKIEKLPLLKSTICFVCYATNAIKKRIF